LAIVYEIRNMRALFKSLTASIDAPLRQINNDKPFAQILEKCRPSAIARSDLKDRVGRHKGTDAGQNRAVPLHVRAAPSLGPLFAGLGPIVDLSPEGAVLFDCRHDAASALT